MTLTAWKSCSSCSSTWSSTGSSTCSSTGSSTSSSSCSSSSAGVSQFLSLEMCQSFPNVSGTRWNSGFDHGFHEWTHQLFRKRGDMGEHFQKSTPQAEVHCDHRIVDPMLQTLTEKSKNTSMDRQVCLRLHQTLCMHKSIGSLQKVSKVTRRTFVINGPDTHSTTTCASPKDNFFLNQQGAREDNVSLCRFVVHLSS